MSDIDTGDIITNHHCSGGGHLVGCNGPEGDYCLIITLADEIDALRAELHMANLSCKGYRKERDEADQRTDAAEAKLAAVEALCDKATNTPGYNAHLPAFVKRIRAAISGPVDDA